MEITSIGKENLEYFEPFTGGPLAPDESALGLIHEDAAIGALVLSEKEAVCTIESIFVVPEYRRKGGGTLFLKALTECGQEMIEKGGFRADLLTGPALIPELSYAVFEGDKPEGVLTANRDEEDIFVSLLLVEENNQRILRTLLSAFSNSLSHQAKKGSNLKFINRNEKLKDTLEKMTGQKFTMSGQIWMGVLSL